MLTSPPRRVVAVVLPELPCELELLRLRIGASVAREPASRVAWGELPLAVTLPGAGVLCAVSEAARGYGVREGQAVAEARALVSRLVVRELPLEQLEQALGRVAESALSFGPLVALELPDTVWVEVTGAAHLAGGEAALVEELAARARGLGHVARVVLASGPRLAQALARWSPEVARQRGALVVAPSREAELVAALPVVALGPPSGVFLPEPRALLSAERLEHLARLGLGTLGALARLPREAAAPRLGPHASAVLDLCAGRDEAPLVPYRPPSVLVESAEWEPAAGSREPLLFVLRGLTARLASRLAGRGLAVSALELTLVHDAGMARLAGAPPVERLALELSAPLRREEELWRVLAARLERLALAAPVVGVRLAAPGLARTQPVQLELARVQGGVTAQSGVERLPALLAELTADLGRENVGVLRRVDALRPEAQSRLVRPPRAGAEAGVRRRGGRSAAGAPSAEQVAPAPVGPFPPPASLLRRPMPLGVQLEPGAMVTLGRRLYVIERVLFEHRLEAVEWWTGRSTSRDYFRLWLSGGSGPSPATEPGRPTPGRPEPTAAPPAGLEALAFVDRETGKRWLQGWVS
ncbi:MAG: DNA polymerase Y family protein [Polyangiaceae bacterium]|nr:DNA polymerase Y family protein [Polyangiaceae bacterium]